MVALSSCARTHPSQDCLIWDGWTERHSSPLWLSVGEHVRFAKLVLAFIHCENHNAIHNWHHHTYQLSSCQAGSIVSSFTGSQRIIAPHVYILSGALFL